MVDIYSKDKRSQIMKAVKSACNISTELELIKFFTKNNIV